MLSLVPVREPLGGGEFETHLKLECLQIIGSFKGRGAMSKLTSLDQAAIDRGLITASGGNHGLAVAYAGWAAKVPAKIFLPESTSAKKVAEIESWGAETVIGVEPVGAPTLNSSIAAGAVIELPGTDTEAGTPAPRKSE